MSDERFTCALEWTGASKGHRADYDLYSREYSVRFEGKPELRGTSAPAYHGDPQLHNPEDMLVASVAGCHFLSYVALCARSKIHVERYTDTPVGILGKLDGKSRMTQVTLNPVVTLAPGQDALVEKARALHIRAHEICIIANSVAFPVLCDPQVVLAAPPAP